MVNKKSTKRKTRWRTLSVGEGGAAADTDVTIGTSDTRSTQQTYEGRIKHSTTSITGQTYSKHHTSSSGNKLAHTTDSKASFVPSATQPSTRYNNCESNRSNYYSRSSDKFSSIHHQPSNGYHSNGGTSTSSYKRRPFSSQNSGYASKYYNGSTSNNLHHHRRGSAADSNYTKSTWKANQPTNPESSENKENSTTKPLFNEDDYTRITTPRQDVLFKKGYLSRPKKTTSIATTTDPSSSSSGTMSVVSTEESMTSSMQSFGPEPMDADAFDPLMYPTFYDQNGVFFINPYMSNGFDPYGGQLMMMPYGGGPPFSINPAEYYNNDVQPYSSDELSQKDSSIDSPISPTENPINDPEVEDSDENNVTETTETIDDSPTDTEQPADDKAQTNLESSSPDEGVEDTKASNDDSNETATAEENLCDTPQICPSYYYPYMYGPPPIMPFSLLDMTEGSDNGYFGSTYDNRHNRFKKRKRRPYRAGHSTGVSATTTDYSEDDDFIDNERLHHDEVIPTNGISFFPGLSVAQYNDLIFHTTLNSNVMEFVPRCAQHPSNTLPDEIVPSPSSVEPTTYLVVPKSTLNVDVAEFLPRNYIKPSVDVPEIPEIEESLDDPSQPSVVCTDAPKDIDTSIKPKSNHRYRNIPAVAIPAVTTLDKNKPSYSSISANRINNLIDNRSDKNSVAVVKESLDTAKIAPAKIDQVILKSDLESNVVETPAKKEEFIFVDRNKKQGNNRNNTSKVRNKSTVKGNVCLSKQSKIDRLNSNDKNVIVKPDEKPVVQIEQTVKQLPTYAQIIAPITTKVISSPVTVDPPKQIKVEAVITDENPKILPKPMQPIQAWHTVKSKGKKKIQPVELSEDFWEEKEPEPIVMVAPKITEPTPKLPTVDIVPEVIIEPKPNNPKTAKKPKKSKAKKSSKQPTADLEIIEPNFAEASVDIINECNDQIDSENLLPIEVIEDPAKADEFYISDFDFESDPAIFVNAITPSAIYTEQIVDKTMLNNSSGFSLNGSMNFSNGKFDFGSGGKGSSRVLREEEEMVMRAMRSLTFAKELKVDLMKPIEIELVSAPEELIEDVAKFEQLLNATVAISQDLIKNEDEDRCQLVVDTEAEAVDGFESNELEHTLRDVENVQVESPEELSEAVLSYGNNFQADSEAVVEIEVHHHQLADLSNEFTQNVPEEIIEIANVQVVLVSGEDHLESTVDMETDSVLSIEADEISDAINQHVESAVIDCSENTVDENDIIANDNFKTDMELVGSSAACTDPADIDCAAADNYDDYDEDSSTVVTQLNGYIEDVMVDPNFDTSVDEDDDDDMIIDTVTDGDIEELIKQATKIVELTNGSTGWMNMANDPFDSTTSMITEADDKDHQDRIESPRSSEDSGILDNHEDTMNSSEYDSGDCGVAESVTPPSGSLTQAVSRWLVQKQKEKSVEPILRLPGDPLLSDSIEKSIQRIQISAMLKSYADDDDYGEDDDELMTSDESDNEIEIPAPKNSKSNPLHVLSAENDNDQTCKRVANVNSKTLHATPIDALDQPDILEYWENDPMLQQPPTSANKSRINYAQLLDSVGTKTTDDILLSNNFYKNNDNTKLSNKTNNCSSTSKQQLNHKTAPKSSSFNYFKPPEMSCKIM